MTPLKQITMNKVIELLINNAFLLEASSPDSAMFTLDDLTINIFQEGEDTFTLIKEFENGYTEVNHEFNFEDVQDEIEY